MRHPADIVVRHSFKLLQQASEEERRIGRTDANNKTSPQLEALYAAIRVAGHYCRDIIPRELR